VNTHGQFFVTPACAHRTSSSSRALSHQPTPTNFHRRRYKALRRLYSSLSERHAQQTGFAPVHRVPVFGLVYPLSTINSSLSERTLRASRSTNWLHTSASGSGIWTGSHYLLSYHGTSRAVRSTNWLRTSASVRVFGPYADRPPPPPPILHRSRRRRRRHQHRCLHHHHCRRSRASHSTNWTALPSFMRADAPTARNFFVLAHWPSLQVSSVATRLVGALVCFALCAPRSVWLSPGVQSGCRSATGNKLVSWATNWLRTSASGSGIWTGIPTIYYHITAAPALYAQQTGLPCHRSRAVSSLSGVQPGCRSATGNKLVSWAACRGLASIPRIVRRVPVRTRTRVHVCTHTPCFVLRGDAEREGSACLCLEGRPHGAGRVLVSVRSAGILTTVSAIGRDTDLTSYLLGPRDHTGQRPRGICRWWRWPPTITEPYG